MININIRKFRYQMITLLALLLLVTCYAAAQEEKPSKLVLSNGTIWRCHFVSRDPVVRIGTDLKEVWLYGYGGVWVVPSGKKSSSLSPALKSAAPPSDWTASDFNDRSWMQMQGPFFASHRGHAYCKEVNGAGYVFFERISPTMAVMCLRGKFMVDDPAKAGDMKLSLSYRGGAVVYLNGQEIARASIPDSEKNKGVEAVAEDYPKEVFVKEDGKVISWGFGDPRKCYAQIQKRIRKLKDVALPAKLLRKGVNVISVELHRAPFHESVLGKSRNRRSTGYVLNWCPVGLIDIRLVTDGSGTIPNVGRPAGLQVWNQNTDIRVSTSSYGDTCETLRPIKLVGARNGSYSGQLLIGSQGPLRGIKVSADNLKGPGVIPASAVQVRYPLVDKETKLPFEILSSEPPAEAAAGKEGAVMPVWVTVKVPADAKPGDYTGALTINVDGFKPVKAVINLLVTDWTLPDSKNFISHVGLAQSPESVAMRYKVPLWSDKHFRLMEGSLKQLGLIGNDWLNIPVITHTEFGNVKDSMIPWSRRADGSLAFDYSRLDRYLDLAVKYLGKPKVINFIVTHGTHGNPADIEVKDEKTGEVKTLKLDSAAPGYEKNWKAFGASLYAHMRARGLEKNMYWGYRWDSIGDANLPLILAKVAPKVYWTAGAHRGKEHILVKAYSQLLPFRLPSYSRQGWKNPDFHVLLPREGGSLIAATGAAFPFNFRVAVDRSLCQGMNGVGRMGADYWGDSYGKGLRKEGWLRAGMPNHFMLWPGKDQPEASTRFMALREGFQETEARVYLEQLIDRKSLPEDLAKRAAKVLLDHHRRTLFVPSMCEGWTYVEVCRDWQDRSRALFSVAAEAARAIPLDLGTGAIAEEIPARGKRVVQLRVRNCTSQPRAWTLKVDQPWIVPEKTAGNLKNSDRLSITLDAEKAEPGKTVKGQAILTDTASGREYPVPITARISGVMSFYSGADLWPKKHHVADKGKVAFNTPAGKSESRDVVLNNLSGKVLPWSCKSPSPWIKIEPSSGKAPPQSPISIKVTVTPPDKKAAFHEFTLHVEETGGPVRVDIPLAIHVVTTYSKPELPTGLTAKPITVLKAYDWMRKDKTREMPPPTWCPIRDSGSVNSKGGYDLEGKKIAAFSVEVGFPQRWAACGFGGEAVGGSQAIFEIVVDGKIRACSGFLKPQGLISTGWGSYAPRKLRGLERRLLVVEGLENAKKLLLIHRVIPPPIGRRGTVWQNATLYFKK